MDQRQPQLATQHARAPREPLTVMVFSLLCFLPGDEDPRFWGETQEISSKLFSISDILFHSGSLKVEGLVKSLGPGKFGDAPAAVNPQVTIFWERAGRSLPRPGLKTNWRKPPAQALRKLLQSRSASSSPRRWLGELTPQRPSAGKWFCTLLAALTGRIHPGSRELRPPPPRTEDSEHDILFQIPRGRHITPQIRAVWPGGARLHP